MSKLNDGAASDALRAMIGGALTQVAVETAAATRLEKSGLADAQRHLASAEKNLAREREWTDEVLAATKVMLSPTQMINALAGRVDAYTPDAACILGIRPTPNVHFRGIGNWDSSRPRPLTIKSMVRGLDLGQFMIILIDEEWRDSDKIEGMLAVGRLLTPLPLLPARRAGEIITFPNADAALRYAKDFVAVLLEPAAEEVARCKIAVADARRRAGV